MEKIITIYEKNRQIIHYLIAGGLTTIVSLGVYYFLTLMVFDPYSGVQLQIANIISWFVAVLFAYYANRAYVFKSENCHVLGEMIAFYISRTSTLIIDMGIMFACVTYLGMNDKFVKWMVQVVVTIANYVLSKWIVFKRDSK